MSDNRFGVRFDPFAPLPEPEPEGGRFSEATIFDAIQQGMAQGGMGFAVTDPAQAKADAEYFWQWMTQMPVRDAMAAGSQAFIDAPGSTFGAALAGLGTAEAYFRENLPDYLRYRGPGGQPIPTEDRPTQPGFADIFAQGREPLPMGVTPEEFRSDLLGLLETRNGPRPFGDSGGRGGVTPESFAAKYGMDPNLDVLNMAEQADLRYGDPAVPGLIADIAATAVDVFDAVLRGVGLATGAVNAARRLASLPDEEVLALTRELRRIGSAPDVTDARHVPGQPIPPQGVFDPARGVLDAPELLHPTNSGFLADYVIGNAMMPIGHPDFFGGMDADGIRTFVHGLAGKGYREVFDALAAQGVGPMQINRLLLASGLEAPHAIAITGTGIYTPRPAAVADVVQLPDGTQARELRLLWHAAPPGTPGFQRWDFNRAGMGAGGTSVHGSGTIWMAEDPIMAVSAGQQAGNTDWASLVATKHGVENPANTEALVEAGLRGVRVEPSPARSSGPVLRPAYSTAERLLDLEQPFPDDLVRAAAETLYYRDPIQVEAWYKAHVPGANRMPTMDEAAALVHELLEEAARRQTNASGWHKNDSRYMWLRDELFTGDADQLNDFLRSFGFDGFTATSTELSYYASSASMQPSSMRIYAFFEPDDILNFDDAAEALRRGYANGTVQPGSETAAKWESVIQRMEAGGVGPSVEHTPLIPASQVHGFANRGQGRAVVSDAYTRSRGTADRASATMAKHPETAVQADRLDSLFSDTLLGRTDYGDFRDGLVAIADDIDAFISSQIRSAQPQITMSEITDLEDFAKFLRDPVEVRRMVTTWATGQPWTLAIPTNSNNIIELVSIPDAVIKMEIPQNIGYLPFSDVMKPESYLNWHPYDQWGALVDMPGAPGYKPVMDALEAAGEDFGRGAIDFNEFANRVSSLAADIDWRIAQRDLSHAKIAAVASGADPALINQLDSANSYLWRLQEIASDPAWLRRELAKGLEDFSLATGSSFRNEAATSFPAGTPLVSLNPQLVSPSTVGLAAKANALDSVSIQYQGSGMASYADIPPTYEMLDMQAMLPTFADGSTIVDLTGAPTYRAAYERLEDASIRLFVMGGSVQEFIDDIDNAADLFNAAYFEIMKAPGKLDAGLANGVSKLQRKLKDYATTNEGIREILEAIDEVLAGLPDYAVKVPTAPPGSATTQAPGVAHNLAAQGTNPSLYVPPGATVVSGQPATPNTIQGMLAQMSSGPPPSAQALSGATPVAAPSMADAAVDNAFDAIMVTKKGQSPPTMQDVPDPFELLQVDALLPTDGSGDILWSMPGAPLYDDGISEMTAAAENFFLYGGTLEEFFYSVGEAGNTFKSALKQLPPGTSATVRVELGDLVDAIEYYTLMPSGKDELIRLIDDALNAKGFEPMVIPLGPAAQAAPSPGALQGMPQQQLAGGASPSPGTAAPAATSANVPYQGWVEPSIVGPKIGGKAGFAPGQQDGFYRLADGRDAYVKMPPDPEQAYVEWLAARMYERFGSFDGLVPESMLSQAADGSVMHISPIVAGETLKDNMSLLTPASARSFTEGSLADILMANWDVVGTEHSNLLVAPGELAYRIDNGSAFWKRAMGSTKPDSAINTVSEFETFVDPNMSREYYDILRRAYGSNPNDIRKLFYSDLAEQYMLWRQRGLVSDSGGLNFSIKDAMGDVLPPDVIDRAQAMLTTRMEGIHNWMMEAAQGAAPMKAYVRSDLRKLLGFIDPQ